MSFPFVAEDQLTAADLNTELRAVKETTQEAGETINGATLPVPVYQQYDDKEWYACDANVVGKCAFRGFAISNSTNGNDITIQFNGVVSGFSGLTEGAQYFVQDTAGTIGTSVGTNTVPVGIALSATELLIRHDDIIVSGSLTSRSGGGSDQTYDESIVLNARPSAIYWTGNWTGTAWSTSWNIDTRLCDFQGQFSLVGEGHEGTGGGYFDVGIGVSISGSILSYNQDGFTFRVSIDAGPSGGGSAAFGSGGYRAVLRLGS